LWLQYQHVRGGSEGWNATAILAGMKEMYQVVFKLFRRLLRVAIHNALIIYRSLPNNKSIDSLKSRLSLAQGLMEKHGSGIPCHVHGCPAIEPLPERHRTTFPGVYSCHQKVGWVGSKWSLLIKNCFLFI
jgi:hypothetical protein